MMQPTHVIHHAPWTWPVNLTLYDSNPVLSGTEKSALTKVLHRMAEPPFSLRKRSDERLERLSTPISDALAYIHADNRSSHPAIYVLYAEMKRREKAFWAWTVEEWYESIAPTREEFAHCYGWAVRSGLDGRSELVALAYLLCPHLNLEPLFHIVKLTALTYKIFGVETIRNTVETIKQILESWGYRLTVQRQVLACVCYLLLKNRSPLLDDLSTVFIEEVYQTCSMPAVKRHLFQVSRALVALKVVDKSLPGRNAKKRQVTGMDGRISEEWLTFCQRWYKQSTLQGAKDGYYHLLKMGRWLHVHHPDVTSPADFTYELAAEFVSMVMNMTVGEWADASSRAHMHDKLGQPFLPSAKERFLRAVRTFFRDCQEWHWIPIHLNPNRAFQTPRSLRNLIGPNPRVVQRDLWSKILWAAMNLEQEDLPVNATHWPIYPLELVRAIAVVWCFAALRSDEIFRLRVGCIRWQYEDVMIPETGEVLPKDATCFLDIPVNKTTTAYTKPVHPLVGKRINEWEAVRPKEQLREIDRKTGESVQFVFSYRGTPVAKSYINNALVSLLCRKAGIPEEDNRGRVTSHRARATIASMLYNAKNPLDIFQLQKYLGHKHLSSTQSYVAVDPTQLANQVAKAGYLEQNLATIEVLLDQDAVRSGRASRGEPWKYYDLGHGYCVNDFWAECKHRMACARCPFYRPKESLADQLLEGQANLLHMLEFVQLTEEEKQLVTEGIELHQALIEQLADVPTPTGLTPREMETQEVRETTVIPLKAVKRNAWKAQDK